MPPHLRNGSGMAGRTHHIGCSGRRLTQPSGAAGERSSRLTKRSSATLAIWRCTPAPASGTSRAQAQPGTLFATSCVSSDEGPRRTPSPGDLLWRHSGLAALRGGRRATSTSPAGSSDIPAHWRRPELSRSRATQAARSRADTSPDADDPVDHSRVRHERRHRLGRVMRRARSVVSPGFLDQRTRSRPERQHETRADRL
jgi:hypothetical protein